MSRFGWNKRKIKRDKEPFKSDISKKDKIYGIVVLIVLVFIAAALAIVAAFSNLT